MLNDLNSVLARCAYTNPTTRSMNGGWCTSIAPCPPHQKQKDPFRFRSGMRNRHKQISTKNGHRWLLKRENLLTLCDREWRMFWYGFVSVRRRSDFAQASRYVLCPGGQKWWKAGSILNRNIYTRVRAWISVWRTSSGHLPESHYKSGRASEQCQPTIERKKGREVERESEMADGDPRQL